MSIFYDCIFDRDDLCHKYLFNIFISSITKTHSFPCRTIHINLNEINIDLKILKNDKIEKLHFILYQTIIVQHVSTTCIWFFVYHRPSKIYVLQLSLILLTVIIGWHEIGVSNKLNRTLHQPIPKHIKFKIQYFSM